MSLRIFFSWQSDASSEVGSGFIQSCITDAIAILKEDILIDLPDRDMVLDRDTRSVPGSPPIMETIFKKIDMAAIFIADLTYVGERFGGGRTPNPNVCIEHGYALRSLGWHRVLAVMNTAMGGPKQYELPFDIRHTRWPMAYQCEEKAPKEVRQQAKRQLTDQLVAALRAIFNDKAARAEIDAQTGLRVDIRESMAEQAIRELAFDLNRGGVPQIVPRPRLICRLVPYVATDSRQLDSRMASRAIQDFPCHGASSVETGCDVRQWWKCTVPQRRLAHLNPEVDWFVRLVRPGYLEFQGSIGAPLEGDEDILVDGRHLEFMVVSTLEQMAACTVELGFEGPALISVALDGVEKVSLVGPTGLIQKRIRQMDVTPLARRVASLSIPLASTLRDALDMFWLASGWPDGSPSFVDGEWNGYSPTNAEN
jgi:hypothetical protein